MLEFIYNIFQVMAKYRYFPVLFGEIFPSCREEMFPYFLPTVLSSLCTPSSFFMYLLTSCPTSFFLPRAPVASLPPSCSLPSEFLPLCSFDFSETVKGLRSPVYYTAPGS